MSLSLCPLSLEIVFQFCVYAPVLCGAGGGVAQEDGGGSSAGAEERPGAARSDRGDPVSEETGGGAGEVHTASGGGPRSTKHCKKTKSLETEHFLTQLSGNG